MTEINKVINLIIGLPGSGKTHYANTVLRHLPCVDDITDLEQLPKDVDEFVVVDVNFCDKFVLELAKTILNRLYPDHIIDEIYFEGNAEKARKNVAFRNDGRNVEWTIQRFARIYNPPNEAIKIYEREEN